MQQRADLRINDLTKELHRTVRHEYDTKQSDKKYVIHRVKAHFDLFDEHYNSLKQLIDQYLHNKSEETWISLKSKVNFFLWSVDSFITVTNEIKSIEDKLDNPRLKDKYNLITHHGLELKIFCNGVGAV